MRQAKLIAIAIVEHHDEFLVGTRPRGVELAGLWEFPGGKVHPSEQPAEAAARECLEETGIAVQTTRLLHRHVHDYPYGSVDLHFYHCQLVGPRTEPNAPFRWVTREQLGSLEFPAGNQTVLGLLTEIGDGDPGR
jgi:mutator protein MutT